MFLRKSPNKLFVTGEQDSRVATRTDFIHGERVRLAIRLENSAKDSKVVDEKSAVLSGFYSVVLDSDHLKLNKFPGTQDGNYVSVSSNLCRIAAEAPELIQRRQIGQSK